MENTSETDKTTKAPVDEPEPDDPEVNILEHPDGTTDVTLEVEGKEIHACRAVLAHYSPFFRSMFYSDFKERTEKKVSLPGKDYVTMVTFFKVLLPRSPSAECLINDDNLIAVLAVAEEYQTDQVKVVCQSYIRQQLCDYFRCFYRASVKATPDAQSTRQFSGIHDIHVKHLQRGNTSGQDMTALELLERLTLYLWACDDYSLLLHRDRVKAMIVDLSTCLQDVSRSRHYPSMSLASRVDLLESLCVKFGGSAPVAVARC